MLRFSAISDSSGIALRRRRSRGMSLVEIIITIAVIGILSSLAYAGFGKITDRSRDAVAANLVDTLNKATRNFSYAHWDLFLNPIPGATNDEFMVLRSLQWREPTVDPNQGEQFYKGPYMRPDWNPSASSTTDDWRIQWTGSSWKLLRKGESGTGLKVDFDGADLGTPFVHPANFVPVGA